MSTGDEHNEEHDDQDAGPPGNGLGEPAAGESGEKADRPVEDGSAADEASAESFPSSDPPSSYAGADDPPQGD